MRTTSKLIGRAFIVAGLACLLATVTTAQEIRSEISVQGTGFFTKNSNGRGIRQTSTDSGGILGGYRYRINHRVSAEASYGWNRNSQVYSSALGLARVQADVHQATGGFVINLPVHYRRMSPYILAEGGALVFRPTHNSFGATPGAQQQTVGAFVYGGGFDYPIPNMKHVSMRFEYRGFVYNAPDFGLRVLNTNTITHTAQPSAGIVYRF